MYLYIYISIYLCICTSLLGCTCRYVYTSMHACQDISTHMIIYIMFPYTYMHLSVATLMHRGQNTETTHVHTHTHTHVHTHTQGVAKRARDSALTLSADTELCNGESGVDGGGESCVLLQQNGVGEMVRGDVGGGGDGEVLEMEEEEEKEEDDEEEEDSRSGGDANGGAQVETSASVSLKGLSAGAVKCAETKKCKVKRRFPSAGEDRHTRHSGKKPEEGQSKRRRSPSPLTGKNVSGMNSEGDQTTANDGGEGGHGQVGSRRKASKPQTAAWASLIPKSRAAGVSRSKGEASD